MNVRTVEHKKIITTDDTGAINGFLLPLFNIKEKFFKKGKEPQQVYLTTILPFKNKGPHLHHIRTGFFTCILGDVKIILKTSDGYREFKSGENNNYLSVEVPVGVPALVENIGSKEAFILNMPNPAWEPNMKDEFTADYSDYFSSRNKK
jgi:mannose-6-phosphate isomerase-like protein (cupin superfamily)